jgi:hypothetical protein
VPNPWTAPHKHHGSIGGARICEGDEVHAHVESVSCGMPQGIFSYRSMLVDAEPSERSGQPFANKDSARSFPVLGR